MFRLERLLHWIGQQVVQDDPHPELSRLDRMDRETFAVDSRPTPEHQAARRQFAEHMARVSDIPQCGEQHVSLAGGTFTCTLPRGHADWHRMTAFGNDFGWQPQRRENTPVYDQVVAERMAAQLKDMEVLPPLSVLAAKHGETCAEMVAAAVHAHQQTPEDVTAEWYGEQR